MKEFTLNAESWHFRLANYGHRRINDYHVKYGTDFCTYMRAVVRGAVKALLVYTFSAVLVSWVVYGLYDVAQLLMNPEHEIFPTTVLIGAILFSTFVLLCGGLIGEGFKYLRRELMVGYYSRDKSGSWWKENQPGFITLAYRRLKNKTCFRIKFED